MNEHINGGPTSKLVTLVVFEAIIAYVLALGTI
jgi:hypothetical protein